MMLDLTEAEYDLFRNFLKKMAGVSLRPAKKHALGRKLAARVKELDLPSYAAYFRYLKTQDKGSELNTLVSAVTIDQTFFFRGARQFSMFCNELLPQMIAQKAASKKLRIWSAGCSRGQEPYTLALLVLENSQALEGWDVKILATDIDGESLKTAHRGRYGHEIHNKVPEPFITKYFLPDTEKDKEVFQIKDEVKNIITFRKHNLLKFPYPLKGPVDMIFCRNVMIYFSMPDKKSVLDQFYKLLADGGYLFLGDSESLLGLDDRFTLIRHAVYQKRPRQ